MERRKKRKSRSSQGAQPCDYPQAPTGSDPAAIAKYTADCEAYLRREYGDDLYNKYNVDKSFNS